jgi:molecular chaperone DnaK
VSDPIVGIDLGTSNTVVAHATATGPAQVLADASGFKIHPSVVSFHPTGGVVVGAAAKQRKVIDPKNTIYSVKRLIGRSFNSPEVQTARKRSPFQIKEGANQLPLIVTRGGEFAVPEISAIVLDHAKNVASTALATTVSRAVVTVPASFNDAQRSATATAGSIAGLNVLRVINEPTAAALAYGHTRNLREIIAVYDFGGGTFDITILKLGDQVYEVLGTSGDTFLGGDDLDERLVDRMVEKFLMENRVDLRQNEVSMMRLRAVAEQVKIELSRRSRAMVRIDEIAYGPKGKPLDLQIEIKREEFVRQVAEIIDRTFPVCDEALKLANLTIDHIDDVILVGGTTKIPYVRDQVAKFFAKAPRTDVNPEDAVAVGAALQASALDRARPRRPSRQVPVQAFETEGTFSGETDSNDTVTFAEAPKRAESPVMQATDDLDLLEPTRETPPGAPRKTSAYPQVEPSGRPGQRPVQRSEHVDIFEERTPPPVSPNAPAAPVIGRMTKANVTAPGLKPPPTPPRPTTQSVPVVRPQTQQMPPIARPQTQQAPIVRPPVPPASPQAKTILIPSKAEPGPASTLRGIAPVHEEDDDLGFSDVKTEKAFADIDLGFPNTPTVKDPIAQAAAVKASLAPSTTARGFEAATSPQMTQQLPLAPRSPAPVAPPPSAPPPSAPPPSTSRAAPGAPTISAAAPTMSAAAAPTIIVAPQTAPVPIVAPNPVVIDVTPRGLGIGTVAGFCEELIRRNARVPTEIRKLFTTSRDSQASVRIIVCQGESRRLDNNVVIGDLILEDLPPRPRGETSIEVTFALDANGILQVRARDAQTGREQRASLDIVGTLPQEDVSAAREKLQALRR